MIEFLSYRKVLPKNIWPKCPPRLTEEQLTAREKYMMLWHKELPNKYGIIERFNHAYVACLPIIPSWKTLEIGAGIGGHCKYEDLQKQQYYCQEYRAEFCEVLRSILPSERVICGDIHDRQPWQGEYFDRIIAIHVLEHLLNLPLALEEIRRLLKPGGVFDIVIPCEGGLAHTFARKISAERLFERNFHMDFTPIHLNEHVNGYGEIEQLLTQRFTVVHRRFFPLRIPFPNLNLCVAMRLSPKATT